MRPCRLPAGLPPATCLAFSADSLSLYAADSRGRIRAVDVAAGRVSAEGRAAPPAEASGAAPGAAPAAAPAASSASAAAAAPAASFMPEVSRLCASPDGSWLAAASGGAVHLLRLPGLSYHGRAALGADDGSPVTALTFSADGKLLAVATAAGGVAIVAAGTCAPTQWSVQYRKPLREHLERLPGHVLGLSFTPSPQGRALLAYTPGGFCHIDLSRPVSAAALHAHAGGKRARARTAPGGRQQLPLEPGSNCRLFALEQPCLFLGHTTADAAILVEKPWDAVLQSLPPPLYRNRYGAT